MEPLTREVFGNVVPWMQFVFYGLMLASIGRVAQQVWNRVRMWKRGRPGGFAIDGRLWMRRLFTFALIQKRVHRKSLGAVLHILLFSGFCVLTLGTTLLMIADYGPLPFHRGWYYLIYEITMDGFGVAFCLGCTLALVRRGIRRPAHLGHGPRDWLLLCLLLTLGLSGFAVEALRLHYTQVPGAVASWSAIGHAIDLAFFRDLSVATARQLHLAGWWLHAILVALFFVMLPVTRFLHVLTAPLQIAARSERPMGALEALAIEEVQQTGRVGADTIRDFTRQQLLSLDACMECGRCQCVCPAWQSGKPLSPMAIVTDLRRAAEAEAPEASVHGVFISAEALWACTMCQACVQECPVLVGQVDLIADLRRHLVAEGQISGPPAKAMASSGRQFNPYGRKAEERTAWAAGLNVPRAGESKGFEYLLWLGCAVSYDARAQKVARSLVDLLQRAGVKFAILGNEEHCTGDPARRLGDEFLFQELARANIATLDRHQVRRIVTPCPHCFNSLKHEYAQFGGNYQVTHHSTLLAELLAAGRLSSADTPGDGVTLHDPCYLARANGETAAPREVVKAASGCAVQEMPRHGRKTFCCGAGGGRMWQDEPLEQRVSRIRAEEALRTGAGTVATACPFCLNMMSDAVAALPQGGSIKVLDIAEVLLAAQGRAGGGSAGTASVSESATRGA